MESEIKSLIHLDYRSHILAQGPLIEVAMVRLELSTFV